MDLEETKQKHTELSIELTRLNKSIIQHPKIQGYKLFIDLKTSLLESGFNKIEIQGDVDK